MPRERSTPVLFAASQCETALQRDAICRVDGGTPTDADPRGDDRDVAERNECGGEDRQGQPPSDDMHAAGQLTSGADGILIDQLIDPMHEIEGIDRFVPQVGTERRHFVRD